MGEFDEFRVSFTPDLATPGKWSVLLECPEDFLAGPKGSTQPTVTPQQLLQLRSRSNWPNLIALKTIGQKVWESLMTADLQAALFACLGQAQRAHRGMRLIFSIIGEDLAPANPNQIHLRELPLEALYSDRLSFLAPNLETPISRSLKFKPDRDPCRVALPLRLLVVAATPKDKPQANIQEERQVIQQALEKLLAARSVEMDFCDPPTRAELTTRIQQGYHILHFIGHGAFETVDDDPSPRPHLCLEREDGNSDPLDADTLVTMLQNSGIVLAVMTACSSANPVPNQAPYHATAFDGVAQRLMSENAGINAVVAMQFDLEAPAAVTFSRTFYNNLLFPGRTLDEVVAMCRKSLVGQLNAGHRAWVTPVVYWRCKNGLVFELEDMAKAMAPEVREKLVELKVIQDIFLKNISDVKTLSPENQLAMAPMVAKWQKVVEDTLYERGMVLGETLRLRGGQVKPGETIQCRLTLRLRTPAMVGDVQAQVSYPADQATFSAATPGANTPGINPLVGVPNPGALSLFIQNASKGGQ
jgi:hypothetical protein